MEIGKLIFCILFLSNNQFRKVMAQIEINILRRIMVTILLQKDSFFSGDESMLCQQWKVFANQSILI